MTDDELRANLTPAEYAALEACRAATPGPWESGGMYIKAVKLDRIGRRRDSYPVISGCYECGGIDNLEDADFIVSARNPGGFEDTLLTVAALRQRIAALEAAGRKFAEAIVIDEEHETTLFCEEEDLEEFCAVLSAPAGGAEKD